MENCRFLSPALEAYEAHWKARSGLLISVNWTFLLGATAEALWTISNENLRFRSNGVRLTQNFW